MKMLKPIILLMFLFALQWQTKAGNTIDAEDILEDIRDGKTIFIHDKTIEGVLDFSKVLPEATDIGKFTNYIEVPICFIGCHFQNDVRAFSVKERIAYSTVFMKDVSFQECSFDSAFLFRETVFRGNLMLTASLFTGEFSLEGADIYGGESRFNECEFNGFSKFQRAIFRGNTDFFKAVFAAQCSFQNARFFRELRFNVCTFHENTDMSLLKCFDFYANYSTFMGKILLNDVIVQNRIEFLKTKFNKNANLKNMLVHGKSLFSDVQLSEEINLQGSCFHSGNPDDSSFILFNDDAKILRDTTKIGGMLH